MKTLNLIQNSDEWLAIRKLKLGASDANIIMGESEFMTPRQLFKNKKNPVTEEQKGNFVTDKGHRIEPKIRAMMEIQYGCDLEAVICVTDAYPNYMASLDGYGTNGTFTYVLECKYVGQEDFELVKSGKILPQYKPQLMKQLTLTGADFNILAVATENKEDLDEKGKPRLKYAHVLIAPDIEYIKNKLLPALAKFWKCLEENVEPALVYADVLEDDSEELSDALTRYDLMLKEQEELNEKVENLKKDIFKLAKHDKVICNGIKVYTVKSKPSETKVYDYEGFLKDSNLELPETYVSLKIGKGSTSKQIKFPKPELTENKPAEEMIVKGAHIVSREVIEDAKAHGLIDTAADGTMTHEGKEVKQRKPRRTKAEMLAAKSAQQ